MKHKKALRTDFLVKRRQKSQIERKEASQKASLHLIKSEKFCNSKNISIYLPTNDEFDTSLLIQKIWQSGKKCYLPIIDPSSAKNLIFSSYSAETVLKPNRFGILEPVTADTIAADKLDLVFFPLVAFDQNGNRLGRGGGYYDSTFRSVRKSRRNERHLIGVGYSSQQTMDLPSDEWDVPMDGVLTENGWMEFN